MTSQEPHGNVILPGKF